MTTSVSVEKTTEILGTRVALLGNSFMSYGKAVSFAGERGLVIPDMPDYIELARNPGALDPIMDRHCWADGFGTDRPGLCRIDYESGRLVKTTPKEWALLRRGERAIVSNGVCDSFQSVVRFMSGGDALLEVFPHSIIVASVAAISGHLRR